MKKQITFEDTLNMFTTVVDWNTLSGNCVTNKDLSGVYLQLTNEEFFDTDEFMDGYRTHNDVLQLDAICDLAYVAFYWAAVNGMDKLQLRDLYEHAEICYKFGEASLDGTVRLMEHYLLKKDPFMFVKELLVMIMIRQKDYDILSAFSEVSRSNYSKFSLVKDIPNPIAEVEFITGQGRYRDVSYKIFDGRYIFLAGEDARQGVIFDKKKIVKPSLFEEPEDLTQFIY